MMALARIANLGLALFLEIALLGIVGVWGYHTGDGTFWQWPLAIGAPVVLAVFWCAFLAPRAMKPAPPYLRFVLKVVVFGLGCAALVAIGQVTNAIWFGVASAFNLALLTYWRQ